MGSFDSLWVACPCGKEVEFQSKAGECSMHDYRLDTTPPSVAGDLIGQSQTCECGKTITLRGAVILIPEFR